MRGWIGMITFTPGTHSTECFIIKYNYLKNPIYDKLNIFYYYNSGSSFGHEYGHGLDTRCSLGETLV